MRDFARIDRMMEKIRKYWTAHPDMRFGQLIAVAGALAGGGREPFYTEDDITERGLDHMLAREIPSE